MPARFVPDERIYSSIGSPLYQSDTFLAFSGRSGRETRFHSRLSDVNDDMWAHRSKTSEECRGCRRCDSVHPSTPHGRDLFGRAKPGRAHNIPSGTSFALLMVRATEEGGIRWKERSHHPIDGPKFVRRSSNVMPSPPGISSILSIIPTDKLGDDAPPGTCFDSFVNGLSKSAPRATRCDARAKCDTPKLKSARLFDERFTWRDWFRGNHRGIWQDWCTGDCILSQL